MCSDYTSYLLGVTNDLKKPYLTDLVAYARETAVDVYVIVSVFNVPASRRKAEQHQNYSLFFRGIEYKTELPINSSYPFHNVMKYTLPIRVPNYDRSSGFLGTFLVTLRNNVQGRVYKDVAVCLRPTPPPVRNTTLCAYVSLYNSEEELMHWISYHLYLHVDRIVLYYTTYMPRLEKRLKSLIRQGVIEWVNWMFPQNRLESGLPLQLNHQYAQAMSCYYRHKYSSRFVLLCDTDEYYYVNQPQVVDSLLPFILKWEQEYPEVNAFQVKSNMFMAHRASWRDRNKLLRDGKLFTYFNRKLPEIYSGRIKLILTQQFDGIVGLHDCTSCAMFAPPDNLLRMAHYKAHTHKNAKEIDHIMVLYSDIVVNKRKELFGE